MQRLSGNIVDLVGRRIVPGIVEWADGVIQRIRSTQGPRFPHYIAPGFIDAHVHIESSMLPPTEFARLAVVHGTVATVSDPHEIANVLGIRGVNYMIDDAARSPFKFHFGAPSCVPGTPFESAGATLGQAAVSRLLARPEIRYLSEFMNYPAVLRGDHEAMAKLATARRRKLPIDGHAPGLRGAEAARYAAAGITTDHECFTLAEAEDKLAAGMKILIREGSAAKNFDALAPLLRHRPHECFFCCDDQHPEALVHRHIDHHVRRALAFGADRFDVLRCASLGPIAHYGLPVGRLVEGDPADFIVFRGWRALRVLETFIDGNRVAARGHTLLPRQAPRLINAFRAQPRVATDFNVPAAHGLLNVIGAVDGQLITRHLRLAPRFKAGFAVADLRRDLLKLAVVNRYEPASPVAIGFIRGFGLRAGALASSVAHDSHNIVAVGADDESLAAAVNAVIRHRGALAAVCGPLEQVLPLPIAGLMSDLDGARTAAAYTAVDAFAKSLGSPLSAPFMTLSFMALLVIPELKLSDRGLFSTAHRGFVPVIS